MIYALSKKDKKLVGRIRLNGSKSISNRVLIIRALSGKNFPIEALSTSEDTVALLRLLAHEGEELDAGPAGTTFRFLTAYLALQNNTKILTGSTRMKQRPIGILADSLNQIGGRIEYLEKEGYPPLKIHPPDNLATEAHLQIPAHVSSQFISALLLIAPCLPNGLRLELLGKIVSRPYIEMTLRIMAHFGVSHSWSGQTITVLAQSYQSRPFTVEADWSAASYYYALAAFADEVDLYLDGLHEESLQGDAAIQEIMTTFGVRTIFTETGLHLSKTKNNPETFEYNFLSCPDIAQTLAVVCAGTQCKGSLSGLETLKIKETDRIAALIQELQKIGIKAHEQTPDGLVVSAASPSLPSGVFETYHDHRMAMAFAAFALVVETVEIENPLVVGKSYPAFWEDLRGLGFEVLEK